MIKMKDVVVGKTYRIISKNEANKKLFQYGFPFEMQENLCGKEVVINDEILVKLRWDNFFKVNSWTVTLDMLEEIPEEKDSVILSKYQIVLLICLNVKDIKVSDATALVSLGWKDIIENPKNGITLCMEYAKKIGSGEMYITSKGELAKHSTIRFGD